MWGSRRRGGCCGRAAGYCGGRWKFRTSHNAARPRLSGFLRFLSGCTRRTYYRYGNRWTQTAAPSGYQQQISVDPSNTPAVSFHYDAPDQAWTLTPQTYPTASPSDKLNQIGQTNLKGRLSWAANGSETMVYGYDEAGRMTLKSVCTPSTCPANDHYDMHAIYDLAGHTVFADLGLDSARNSAQPNAGWYYGGLAMSYAQNGKTAGQLLTGTADIVDGSHPANIVSGLQYSPHSAA